MRYEFSAVPQAMPLELFATTPPIVQAASLAGSGPRRWPCRASRALTWRTVAPGWARTRRPPSSTSMRPNPCRTSTSSPAPDDCPDRLVPPERNVTGVREAVAARRIAPTSAASAATTTASGVRR